MDRTKARTFLRDADWEAFGYIMAIAVLIIVGAWAMISDDRDFAKYVRDNHCQAVGTRKGQMSYGVTANGTSALVSESDQTIYRCDGGAEVIR